PGPGPDGLRAEPGPRGLSPPPFPHRRSGGPFGIRSASVTRGVAKSLPGGFPPPRGSAHPVEAGPRRRLRISRPPSPLVVRANPFRGVPGEPADTACGARMMIDYSSDHLFTTDVVAGPCPWPGAPARSTEEARVQPPAL